MSTPRFSHIGLRTKDVLGAADFYSRVFDRPVHGIFELPAAAAARGAPSHWLGFITFDAPEPFQSAVDRFLELGAERLGPNTDKAGAANLRDPGGAIVGLAHRVRWPSEPLAWCHLHTAGAGTAARNYSALFGWSLQGTEDAAPYGRRQLFAFAEGEPRIGSIGDIAARPEIHPHWAFFFEVPDVRSRLTLIPALGGTVIGEANLTDGTRIAMFEDPQGAEFGLLQRP